MRPVSAAETGIFVHQLTAIMNELLMHSNPTRAHPAGASVLGAGIFMQEGVTLSAGECIVKVIFDSPCFTWVEQSSSWRV
jgi:hypothetical protein